MQTLFLSTSLHQRMAQAIFNRAQSDTNTPSTTAPWRVKDIVYIGIVGWFMLMALVEWLLWLLAFLYCLMKVYQKAQGEGRWAIRALAVTNGIIFTAFRLIFLPIMLVTLPLPAQLLQQFPREVVEILQWASLCSINTYGLS
jgi:chitin synthase